MQVLAYHLRAPLRQLVVDAAVVLLVGVQLAEVHRLHQPRTAPQERFDAAVFHGGDDLSCEGAKIISCPLRSCLFCLLLAFLFLRFLCLLRLLLFLYLLLLFNFGCCLVFLLLWLLLLLQLWFGLMDCLDALEDEDHSHQLLICERTRRAGEPKTVLNRSEELSIGCLVLFQKLKQLFFQRNLSVLNVKTTAGHSLSE